MLYQLSVLYNHPEDPAAFDKHYREVHAPLARKAPNLAGFAMNFCEDAPDGAKPAYHLIAMLTWATKDEMLASLGSPEFGAARDDLANFAAAGVQLVFGETETVV